MTNSTNFYELAARKIVEERLGGATGLAQSGLSPRRFFNIFVDLEEEKLREQHPGGLPAEILERGVNSSVSSARESIAALSPTPASSALSSAAASAKELVIENLPDRYRLHKVQYRNALYTVDWSKPFLQNGAAKTQDEWIADTAAGESRGEWTLPDAPLYYAIWRHLWQNREHPDERQKKRVEKFGAHFRKNIGDHRPDCHGREIVMTSTRACYTSMDEDLVTHRYGYANQQQVQTSLVGKKDYITEDGVALEGILGTRNSGEVHEVGNWIFGRNIQLERLKSEPFQIVEHIVDLGFFDGGFYGHSFFRISTICDLKKKRPAHGVIIYPPAKEKTATPYQEPSNKR